MHVCEAGVGHGPSQRPETRAQQSESLLVVAVVGRQVRTLRDTGRDAAPA